MVVLVVGRDGVRLVIVIGKGYRVVCCYLWRNREVWPVETPKAYANPIFTFSVKREVNQKL